MAPAVIHRVLVVLVALSGTARAVAEADAIATEWSPERPPRDWKYILVHHSATEVGSLEAIDLAHRQRLDADGNPWRGIGYHFVIGNGHGMRDGEIQATFRWDEQLAGAHAGHGEYNQHGIGICLIGNFEESPPTESQMRSMSLLIQWLKKEYSLPPDGLVRHQDVRSTACPGRLFPWEELSQNWRDTGADNP